ncbi:MAG: hypothetical protein K5864_03570 [Bacteroidales bacterium]|nr:hypothetical protein [Bacteroidales bacterium]
MNFKRYTVSFIVFIALITGVCKGQEQENDLKAFLFLSVFNDELLSVKGSSTVVNGVDSIYDNYYYECTPPIALNAGMYIGDTLYNTYKIQLYKVNLNKRSRPHYFLRLYPSSSYYIRLREEVWIRVSGYRESDIKILFDYLREQGVSKAHLKKMVKQWSESHELFHEIDWDCIMKGYIKNDTHCDCYNSEPLPYLIYREWEPVIERYSVFSNYPLSGRLEPMY